MRSIHTRLIDPNTDSLTANPPAVYTLLQVGIPVIKQTEQGLLGECILSLTPR